MKGIILAISLALCTIATAKTYYVAPQTSIPPGNDSNPGTISAPWATFQKAISMAHAGDTVLFRGGVYYHSERIKIDPAAGYPYGRNGVYGNPICYFAYPGESPVFDFSLTPRPEGWENAYHACLDLFFANFIYFKGLTFRNLPQHRQYVQCTGLYGYGTTNLTLENITVHDIAGAGIKLMGGYVSEMGFDTTRFVNCDSYNNCDTFAINTSHDTIEDPYFGGSGDGFFGTGDTTTYMLISGCRSWNNSDDAFDFTGVTTTVFINNWAFNCGRYTGDGTGFKFGGYDTSEPSQVAYYDSTRINAVFIGNLSANNWGASYQDYDRYGRYRNNGRFYNNISYLGETGFMHNAIWEYQYILDRYYNNIAYKHSLNIMMDGGWPSTIHYHHNAFYYKPGWGWYMSDTVTVTDDDFLSLDITELQRPRKSDGSLPEVNFLKLAPGSDLIDAGTTYNYDEIADMPGVPQLTFKGSAPDIGYSEFSSGTGEPIYLNSVIQNTTPAKLEITYSLSLANVTPATSTFTVMVNSIARTVNTVAISGTKVLLTLTSPIANGDKVTVAYTKPAVNPLQTTSGVQAPSISAQNVTNNVAAISPVYVSSVIENATPSKLEMTFTLTLANIVPATSAFNVKVNSGTRNVTSLVVLGTKVILTLASPVIYGDAVTIAYTKPSANPLQTPAGGQAASFSAQSVINNCSQVNNQVPIVTISSPTKNISFTAPASIVIDANASDPDGTIKKVEFFNGNSKLGECTTLPYTFVWKNVSEGTYILTAVATDNLNSISTSEPVSVVVLKSGGTVNQLPVISIKNPNNGRKFKKNEKIIIEAVASDPDGGIVNVEFKNGDAIIAEFQAAPYIYVMENADTGKYVITAVATDNLGATSASSGTEFLVYDPNYHDLNSIKIFPNPNNGHFTLDLSEFESEFVPDKVRILDMSGKTLLNNDMADQEVFREFNLTDTSPGTYVMTLTRKNRVVSVGKFIIK